MTSAILTIAKDVATKIEALTPTTKFRADEAFHREGSLVWDSLDADAPANDAWHRGFRVVFGSDFQQGEALQAHGEFHRSITSIRVDVLYAGLDWEDLDFDLTLQSMMAEDRYKIIATLENIRTFPSFSAGGMYRREYRDGILTYSGGRGLLTLTFEIEYWEG
jgi:hypothetical protein